MCDDMMSLKVKRDVQQLDPSCFGKNTSDAVQFLT